MRRFLALFAMLMLSAFAFAQTRLVTGKVTDDSGNPVPFATVTVAKTKTATNADANGNFSIAAPANGTLVFSSTGLTTQQVSINNQESVSVILATPIREAIVVTAQGIRRQPKSLGYSTTRISSGDLTQGKVLNAANGLTGKVSGLQVLTVNNGVTPGVRITLRGTRSILGNNQALLVVDDVPVPLSYLASINPNDIDNTTILKGASASALYGSQASNGVLIVTTKRGTKGVPVIKYSNTTQFEEVSYLPKLQNQFGAFGGEYDASQFPGVQYFPTDPFRPYVPYENQNYGPAYNGLPITIGAPVRIVNADGTFTDSLLHGTYSAKPGAKKGFFDKGLTIQNDFSVSGGDDNSRYFISLQDINVTGIVPKDKSHRNTFRINGSRDIGKFTLGYSASYTIAKTNTTPTPGTFATNGTIIGQGGSYFQNRPVYWTVINTPSNIDLRDYRNWRTDPFANPNGYYNAYYGNPWWQIDASRLDERKNDLLSTVYLSYKPTKWLNLTGRVSMSRSDYNSKNTREGFKFSEYAQSDVYGSGNIPSGVHTLDPISADGFSYANTTIGDFLAIVDKSFGPFTAKFIAGTQAVDNRSRYIGISANALVIPDFYNISNKVGEANVGETFFNTRSIGAYGDLTVGYKDFLFVHGSLRNDWTSLLAKKNRSFLYPAGDVSFVFSDAFPGLKTGALSLGKLRAAISKTAQVNIGPYALANVFNTAGGFPYGNVAGFSIDNNFANPDIKPENTREVEFGLELGFLNNRIYFQGAVYQQNTTNQTLPIAISSTTGGTSALINTGEMQNRGVELDLNFTPLLRAFDGFRWNFGVNFTYNENKVLSIAPGLEEVNVGGNAYATVGQPYPTIKGLDFNRDSSSGKIIIDPKNGYPTVDNSGPKPFGTATPPYKVGLTTSVQWRGFTFSAVADYRAGAVILNDLGGDLDFTGVSAYSAQNGRQRFVIPNTVYKDASGKYVPNTNITTQSGNENFWASTWNQADAPYMNSADFWKLRELAINYDFGTGLLKNKWIKGISFGIVGRNLFMWRAKENIWTDPEFATTTGNGVGFTNINQTPPTRLFGANVTLTF